MKILAAVLLAISLAACAFPHDSYVPQAGTASAQNESIDYRACRTDANFAYLGQHPPVGFLGGLGAFGAVGGAAAGGVTAVASADVTDESKLDLSTFRERYITRCMAAKGYTKGPS